MQTLLQYLANLALDPAGQQAFAKDPEAAIAAADLGDADKAVLRTRNPGLIHATVGQQALAALVYAAQPPTPQPPLVYATQHPNLVYAAQPPLVYATPHPNLVYAAPHPNLVYAAQPPLVYPMAHYAPPVPPAPMAAPLVYAHAPGAAPLVYAHAPGAAPLVYVHAQPPPSAALVYATAPQPPPSAALVYATAPQPQPAAAAAPLVYATEPGKDEPPR